MKKYHTVQKEVEELEDVLCNACGNSCKVLVGRNSKGEEILDYGGCLVDAEVCGGYGSKYLDDGDQYKFDLCESCVATLIKSFKIDAKVGNFFFNEVSEEDQNLIDEGEYTDTDFLLDRIICQTEKDAINEITNEGFTPRITKRNGRSYICTRDYKTDRINLEIKEGVVAKATIG
jgi:hypothetical protein